MVAKPISSGTRISNTRFEVSISSTAPIPAPTTDASTSPTKPRSSGGNCVRSDKAAIRLPGVSAAMLVAMAAIGGQSDGEEGRKGDQRRAAGEARNRAADKSGCCQQCCRRNVHDSTSGEDARRECDPLQVGATCKDAMPGARPGIITEERRACPAHRQSARRPIRRTPEFRSARGRGSAHGCRACPRRC